MEPAVVDCDVSKEVRSLAELEETLDAIEARTDRQRPVIATIQLSTGDRVDIGLGSDRSFLIVWPDWFAPEKRPDTYYITVGDPLATGFVDFWLQGVDHSEFEARHLVAPASARSVLLEFVRSGTRSDEIEWAQEFY